MFTSFAWAGGSGVIYFTFVGPFLCHVAGGRGLLVLLSAPVYCETRLLLGGDATTGFSCI